MTAPGFTVSAAKVIRKNSLIGSFDLRFPSGLIVRGVMLFQKNGKRLGSFPSKEWTTSDGVKKYTPIIEFETRATSGSVLVAGPAGRQPGVPRNRGDDRQRCRITFAQSPAPLAAKCPAARCSRPDLDMGRKTEALV